MIHDIYIFFYEQFAYCCIHPVINWPAEDQSKYPGLGNLTLMSINFHWSFEIGNKKVKLWYYFACSTVKAEEKWEVKVRESVVELKLKDSMLLISSGSWPLDFLVFHLFSKVNSKRN